MNFTALEISEKFSGSIEGNGDVLISKLSKIEEAEAGALSFIAHPKYIPFLALTKASAVLVAHDLETSYQGPATLIRVTDPYIVFTQLMRSWAELNKTESPKGIHATALIDPTATVAKGVAIGPYVTIGPKTRIEEGVLIQAHCAIGSQVTIGKGSILNARVTVMDETEIGSACIIHPGVVIGSDGFGFAPQENSTYLKTPHLGKVIIKNKVEIGANTTIDRATLGATLIEEGVKLDNLVQIAHNVEIGPHTVIAAQTGIAGSSKIGSHCIIGGQVGIAGHLNIGDHVSIQGQTGVVSNLSAGSTVQGTPAYDYRSYYKSYALFKRFPAIEKRLSSIEKKN